MVKKIIRKRTFIIISAVLVIAALLIGGWDFLRAANGQKSFIFSEKTSFRQQETIKFDDIYIHITNIKRIPDIEDERLAEVDCNKLPENLPIDYSAEDVKQELDSSQPSFFLTREWIAQEFVNKKHGTKYSIKYKCESAKRVENHPEITVNFTISNKKDHLVNFKPLYFTVIGNESVGELERSLSIKDLYPSEVRRQSITFEHNSGKYEDKFALVVSRNERKKYITFEAQPVVR